jgi:Phage virion morphogenesis family.
MTLSQIIGRAAVQRIQRRIRENKITPRTDKSNKKGQKGTTLIESKTLVNKLTYLTQNTTDGSVIKIGSNLDYAQIQHEGGTITQKITKKMRSFFWAKFYDTKVEKWKFIAMSKGGIINIKIPARPYLFLDADDQNYIAHIALEYINKTSLRRS